MRVRDLPYAQATPQAPLAFCLDGRVIHGAADALFQSRDGHWAVLDFKTDRIKPEDVGDKTDEYPVQLVLNQSGIQEGLGESRRLIVYYLFPGTPIEIDSDRLVEARAQVGSIFDELSP